MAPGFFQAPTNVFPCFPRRLWEGNPCIAQGHHGQTIKQWPPKEPRPSTQNPKLGMKKTASTVIDLFFIVCYIVCYCLLYCLLFLRHLSRIGQKLCVSYSCFHALPSSA